MHSVSVWENWQHMVSGRRLDAAFTERIGIAEGTRGYLQAVRIDRFYCRSADSFCLGGGQICTHDLIGICTLATSAREASVHKTNRIRV